VRGPALTVFHFFPMAALSSLEEQRRLSAIEREWIVLVLPRGFLAETCDGDHLVEESRWGGFGAVSVSAPLCPG